MNTHEGLHRDNSALMTTRSAVEQHLDQFIGKRLTGYVWRTHPDQSEHIRVLIIELEDGCVMTLHVHAMTLTGPDKAEIEWWVSPKRAALESVTPDTDEAMARMEREESL